MGARNIWDIGHQIKPKAGGPKIHEIVFELRRPVAYERILDTYLTRHAVQSFD
jgi:hypothetical protein